MEDSKRLLREVLEGGAGPTRNVVLMNAAAALVAADRVASLKEGVTLASKSIDSGAAQKTLDALIALSNDLE